MRELSLNVMDVAQNSVRAKASLVTITVDESDKDDFLQISIADDGCGMTEEQVQQVIDPAPPARWAWEFRCSSFRRSRRAAALR